MTPQKHKDETLRSLVDLTEAIARKQLSVMLYEDLHWADPTSLEVLDLLIDRVRTIPLLIVFTHRPEFRSRWAQHGHVTGLNLSKLTRAQSGAMVSRVTGTKALPADLLEEILTKTDGVPLFVEELTKSILESGELKDAGDHYDYSGTAHSITIPATLRDSLMARLDRLGSAKEVAQLAAVLGREFTYDLVQRIAPQDQNTLQAGLGQLVAAELLYQRGRPPRARYVFKHALIQDAAYASLLKSVRQQIHQRTAQVLEAQCPEIVATQPELLAHHLTEAGRLTEAVGYWQRAGERAVARSAHLEAISHLTTGVAVLQTLPETAERIQQELL
ncbi:MAG TPA: hypothetical protein VFD73_26235, partial [Gemmatimonadales bacterium]|nr:hypothetical protein [Gemmatimonadales bacterium]